MRISFSNRAQKGVVGSDGRRQDFADKASRANLSRAYNIGQNQASSRNESLDGRHTARITAMPRGNIGGVCVKAKQAFRRDESPDGRTKAQSAADNSKFGEPAGQTQLGGAYSK